MVCTGSICTLNRSFQVKETLQREINKRGLENEVLVVPIGCFGYCAEGPIVLVYPEGIFYHKVTEVDIPQLVEEHLLKGRVLQRLVYTPPEIKEPIPKMSDIPFFSKQMLIAMRNRGVINPENIDEYIARDGYAALAKVVTSMTPEEVIAEIKVSGLRGRGGGGFPTGVKWESCRKAEGKMKYVVCNADEGDPGAYMDRSLIESDPHSIIEGMVIGAYAIGSHYGYIYVRKEYPLALERFKRAVGQAHEYGLLGDNILNSGFTFDIEIHRGAGSFVCGESTALMASLEGRVGEPRAKYIHTVEQGVWKSPTALNNVETWANVPIIILRGAKWFAEIGTEKSKGTKVFSLVGKINNAGLVEVPMGITLREIIYDIGGGIPDGKKFKAVQTGGPSGGCLPERLLELPVDYEQLTEAGSMMGSGGMIIMNEDDCMVDIAKYFINFLKDESCGKCVPCREGLRRMYEILDDITQGRGVPDSVGVLEELCKVINDASLCALGGSAPNPVLTTIRYFRDEYEAHIKYKKCPACICSKIIFTPCKYNCPLETDIPAFIAYISRGKYDDAFETIRRTNPFPIVTGLICHHPCENRCRAGDAVGESISIKALKQFVGKKAFQKGLKPVSRSKPSKREKVAIIGAGPAGLTAGYELAKEGYPVTIFDSSPVAGGMLSGAIPQFRLPQDILRLEIEAIKSAGVEIKHNTHIGTDLTLDDLFKKGYKAIFIATGAWESINMNIPGEDADGVLDALELLKNVNAGRKVKIKIGERVAVIGGGNAAIDAARTAWRLGAKKVTIIYRRTRAEMPAMKTEVDAGIEEGIEIRFLCTPVKVRVANGKLKDIECLRMKLGDFDSSGRRRPVPIEGSEFTMELDTLIPAIGQRPDLSFLPKDSRIKISARNTIEVDPETLATGQQGVFAGGDVVMGPSTIADSAAQGKLAAQSIMKYLRGESLTREYKVTEPCERVEPMKLTDEEIEELAELMRPKMPCLAMEKRANSFEKVELGLTEDMAIKEARRCLRCDLVE
jgi:NADH-quinone oxidoreductase subunit F